MILDGSFTSSKGIEMCEGGGTRCSLVKFGLGWFV